MTRPAINPPADENTEPGFASELYWQEANTWRAICDKHYPGSQLVKPGHNARTFRIGNTIVKIDIPKSGTPSMLEHEYEILFRADRVAGDFSPRLSQLTDNNAVALEMNVVEGTLLNELLLRRDPIQISITVIIWTLFRLSLRGIYYRQLRPRHVLVRDNGRFALIDFGGSELTSPILALLNNFIPFSNLGLKGGGQRLIGLILAILKHRIALLINATLPLRWREVPHLTKHRKTVPPPPESYTLNKKVLRTMFLSNFSRYKDRIGYSSIPPLFKQAEQYIQNAVAKDGQVLIDLRRFDLGYADVHYIFFGANSLNLIWEHFISNTGAKSKRILDWYGGQGILSALAKIEGAEAVLYCEPNKALTLAAQEYHQAFGVEANVANTQDIEVAKQFKPDTVFLLSKRIANPVRVISELTSCQTAIIETGHLGTDIEADLNAIGFVIKAKTSNWNEPTEVIFAERIK